MPTFQLWVTTFPIFGIAAMVYRYGSALLIAWLSVAILLIKVIAFLSTLLQKRFCEALPFYYPRRAGWVAALVNWWQGRQPSARLG
jgi:hypothetical protein